MNATVHVRHDLILSIGTRPIALKDMDNETVEVWQNRDYNHASKVDPAYLCVVYTGPVQYWDWKQWCFYRVIRSGK
jgi:hypothetical protein